MKIKTKYCGIIYIFIILFVISILGLSYHLRSLTSKAINNIVKYRSELEMVSQLEMALIKILMPANDYLIHGHEHEKDTFENLDADVNKYFSLLEGKYFPTHLMTEGREYINKLKDQYSQIRAFSVKIFNLDGPIGNVEGAHLMEEMDLLAENMLEDMKVLHRRSRLSVLVETESIEAHFSLYMIIVLSVLGVAIIVSFFYGIFLTKGIIVPIGCLVEYMGFVANGDFNRRLDINKKDEIGFLCNSFNKMTEDLQKTTVSKNYVDNVIKSMTDTLIVITPDGIIQTVNQATRNLLGYREEQLVGQPIDMVFEKDTIFKESRTGELTINVSVADKEKTYLSKDGRKIPVLFSNSIMRNSEGKIQGIVCIAQDITELKRTEEALLEREAKYRQVHATSFDGIVIADTGDRIIEVNKRAEQIFGYKPGDLVGRRLIEIIPEHFREQHCAGMKKFLETGEIKIQGRILELEGLRKNGDVFPIELTVSSFVINENIYFTGTLRDITERKEAEDLLKETASKLRDKNESLERFHKVTVGRELEMIKLKKEVDGLLEKSDQPKKYEVPDKVDKG